MESLRVGQWEVHPDLNRIRSGDREVHLEPKLMDLLVCLAEQPGRVLPPHHLIDQVWHREFVGSSVLSRSIALLRRALGDDARCPRYIETIAKRGYRLMAPVEALGPPEPGTRIDAVCGLLIGAAEVPLHTGDNVIGSDAAAVIRIDSPGVAPRQAAVRVTDSGAVLLNLGAAGGTWWRGTEVTTPVDLADGDTIRVGPLHMVFSQPSTNRSRGEATEDAKSHKELQRRTRGSSTEKSKRHPFIGPI